MVQINARLVDFPESAFQEKAKQKERDKTEGRLQKCQQNFANYRIDFMAKKILLEGGIEFFGFAVLVTFEIGFSVYVLKITGFSVLVSTVVFGFSLFDIRVWLFMNKKVVIRFLLFACLVPRPLPFSSVTPFWTVLGNVDIPTAWAINGIHGKFRGIKRK